MNAYIDLNELSGKKSRIVKWLILEAIVCVISVAGSVFVFLSSGNASMEWVLFLVAIYLALYIYFTWITLSAKLFVKADNSGVVFKFGILNRSKNHILWDTISKVRIGPTYVLFFKKSGRKKRVYLGWLTYKKVLEIKELVRKVCSDIGIPCEMVRFKHYSRKKK